jgi:gluconokinase
MSTSPTIDPVLIITMGVSGCGKSTAGKYLSERYGMQFLEADDFHSEENKTHMASGKPLTDAMREPWIVSMCNALKKEREKGNSCVLAYSGLRRAHRQRFRELGYPVLFLHLAGPKDVIRARMESRPNHFMPSNLLDSQFASLEPALNEPDIIEVDVAQDIPAILSDTLNQVEQFLAKNR